MDGLPGHLLDEILFRIDPRSLAITRCTNRSLRSHTRDPYFESEYFSRVGSGLLHISSSGSNMLCYQPYGDSRSRKTCTSIKLRILGSCSGLLLLFTKDGLCVTNPFTKRFRFLKHPSLRLSVTRDYATCIGFAVNQTDRTTQRFKIVHMYEVEKATDTEYRFEINDGDSWRYSKTTITCRSRNLDDRMKAPVYLDGSLHWLRNDGSIVAFNPETEQARLIPTRFPEDLSLKTHFAAGDSSLALISTTEEVIYVYALDDVLGDPKWVLLRRIQNGMLDKMKLVYSAAHAYDGKRLVLSEERPHNFNRVVHVYDLSADKWAVMGSIPGWCDANRHSFHIALSLSSVVGLDEILAWSDKRISLLSSIMGLIDGTSSENVEKQLRRRSLGGAAKKLASFKNK